MPLSLGIPKENMPGENRVAMVPDAVKRLLASHKGLSVYVEKGAGEKAGFPDTAYKEAGATLVDREKTLASGILLCVNGLPQEFISKLKKSTLLIGLLNPAANEALFKKLAKAGIDAIAMEKIPRISRAQGMDALSSQANIGGYRAVLEATQHFNRFFPLMMTAAGSSKPAKTVVLGAGVAGLQAIATARRLGAQVEAFDVRPEVKEQVESLGAKFIEIDVGESGSGEGGYAKELSAEAKKKQQDGLQDVLKKADIVITTAQIPGKPAPVLVTENTVKSMASGSVIVDMAAASGGNCPLTQADKVITEHGITLVGHTSYPSMMASDSSAFYARNLLNLLQILLKNEKEKTVLNIDMEDEIINGAVVVSGGKVVD